MGRPSLLTVGGKAHVETITAGPDETDQVQPLESGTGLRSASRTEVLAVLGKFWGKRWAGRGGWWVWSLNSKQRRRVFLMILMIGINGCMFIVFGF